MKHSYIIIDDNQESLLKTLAVVAGFHNLHFVASATNYNDGLNLILEHNPKIVFLEIDPEDITSKLSLQLINELYRYLKEVPNIIITTKGTDLAFEAIKYDVLDYLVKPLQINELRKTILKFEKTSIALPQFFNTTHVANEPLVLKKGQEKNSLADSLEINEKHVEYETVSSNPIEELEANHVSNSQIVDQSLESSQIVEKIKKEDKPLIICVKSYGDYRFIEAKDICYLQADNNSTDIHLYNGEMITAFKTLKHFEGVLTSPFVRIHNSYIVNIDYVSRIHTGNAVCYIKNTTTKLPFSKSYKENVDSIINSITNGNYLEI